MAITPTLVDCGVDLRNLRSIEHEIDCKLANGNAVTTGRDGRFIATFNWNDFQFVNDNQADVFDIKGTVEFSRFNAKERALFVDWYTNAGWYGVYFMTMQEMPDQQLFLHGAVTLLTEHVSKLRKRISNRETDVFLLLVGHRT